MISHPVSLSAGVGSGTPLSKEHPSTTHKLPAYLVPDDTREREGGHHVAEGEVGADHAQSDHGRRPPRRSQSALPVHGLDVDWHGLHLLEEQAGTAEGAAAGWGCGGGAGGVRGV